ncbi:hypothetical protein EYF80_050872 [Liparis tanakae]|uniref:Uncharacterized protein n=1 Tax=Liparis tanakae TaxID=230148 RepID=A0A4Z2FCI9_9TELE|nr:hypothetical protein EYF80_050872 [Liparis tanakae]
MWQHPLWSRVVTTAAPVVTTAAPVVTHVRWDLDHDVSLGPDTRLSFLMDVISRQEGVRPELHPGVRRHLAAAGGARRPLAERAARRRAEVEHQREHGAAGHVGELDLAPAQVLPGREGVDLAGLGGAVPAGRLVVRVLDAHLPPRLAREDVRLAAAQPDVTAGPRGFRGDLIAMETQRVQPLDALELLPWNPEADGSTMR